MGLLGGCSEAALQVCSPNARVVVSLVLLAPDAGSDNRRGVKQSQQP
jgi:hypothetical protein